jgi:demethylmenaquinone methyltransferase/2-methoxy-6-polyprenyl-1,4-benzoquinol methylase
MVDSRYEPTSTARDHTLEGPASTRVTRKLNDGRTFRIVKVFHRPEELGPRLAGLGWTATFRETGTYFLYGFGSSTG